MNLSFKINSALLFLGCLVLSSLHSCIFTTDSSNKPEELPGDYEYDYKEFTNPVTGKQVRIDFPFRESVDGNGILVREVFWPRIDTTSDGRFTGRVGELTRLNTGFTTENDREVKYIIRSQSIGFWNQELEYYWNKFMVQTQHVFTDQIWLERDSSFNITNMIGSLEDPFSGYIDSVHAASFLNSVLTTNIPGAIGIRIEVVPTFDSLKVKSVAPNSPAFDAGIQKNHVILEVNGQKTTGDSALIIFNLQTKGDSGTALNLTLQDTKDSTYTVDLVKRPVSFPSVLVDTLEQTGYIRVFSFTGQTTEGETTASEFTHALESTADFDHTILDFRGNPGGLVTMVNEMLDDIVDQGVLYKQKLRYLNSFSLIPQTEESDVTGSPGGTGLNRKFTLLADGGTASASEIFIASVRDRLGIQVYGEATYGKGVGQSLIKTPGHGVLRVTVIRYFSPEGISYNKTGINPDIPIPSGDALKKALDDLGSPLAKKSAEKKLHHKLLELEFDFSERKAPSIGP